MGLCRECVTGSPGACANAKGCQPQRENLIEEATLATEWFGHALSEFSKLSGVPISQSKCTICGRTLTVGLASPNAEDSVSGGAVSAFCGDHDEGGQELTANRAATWVWHID